MVTAKGRRPCLRVLRPVPGCRHPPPPGGAHGKWEGVYEHFPCTLPGRAAPISYRFSYLLLCLHLAESICLSPTKDLQSPLVLALSQYTKHILLKLQESRASPEKI